MADNSQSDDVVETVHTNGSGTATASTSTDAAADFNIDSFKFRPTFTVPSEYFILKRPANNDTEKNTNWLYKCQTCKKVLSVSYRSKHNLNKHINSQHSGAVATCNAHCIDGHKTKREAKDQAVPESQPQTKLSRFFGGPGGPARILTQQRLDQYIVQYLAESVLPFYHVETDGFKNFVSGLAPNLSIKSRKTYREKTKEMFLIEHEKLKNDLSAAQKVCLTIDHWAAHHKGYVGITAHWYETESDLKSKRKACVALRRIIGRCTFDVLAKLIESVISECKITGKVSHCITDSGSNFLKAFREFGTQELLATDDAADSEPAPHELPSLQPIEVTAIFDENSTEDTLYELPPHMRCAAHRLNLVATNTAALENERAKKVYRSLTGKLQSVWNKQNYSVLTSDKIRGSLGMLFVVPNKTRWNSTFDAMVRVQKLISTKREEMTALFIALELRPITENETTFLDEYLKVLKPIALALDILQGDIVVTCAYLLPTILNILEEWKTVELTDLTYCSGWLCELTASLKTRFKDDLESPFLKVASALHPRFRLAWLSDDATTKEVTDLVKAALSKYETAAAGVAETTMDETEDVSTENAFFWRIQKRKTELQRGEINSIYSKWLSWCSADTDDVPDALRNAFIDYNTSIPSSAAVERLFSLGKRVLSPTRTLLSDEAFEWMVILPSCFKA